MLIATITGVPRSTQLICVWGSEIHRACYVTHIITENIYVTSPTRPRQIEKLGTKLQKKLILDLSILFDLSAKHKNFCNKIRMKTIGYGNHSVSIDW